MISSYKFPKGKTICLSGLRFERYFWWWEKYLSKRNPLKHNIFSYIKTHYGETILAKVQKLEKTMIKYSSYTNYLRFSLHCHHNKILPKDLQLKSKMPNDGRSISQNVAHWNILVHDVINLLYYEYWTDKQKYFYIKTIWQKH